MRASYLFFIYLVVVSLPLVLGWLSGREPRSFRDELASGAAMLAFAIILVEFLLSGRFRPISRDIGMDVTMRLHQLFGRTALFLALIHPFLYKAPFNPPLPWDTSRQLTLTADFTPLLTGILAWVLLPGFVLLSIARDSLPYKYETWRLMHGLGALAIAAALLHHTLGAGRYAQDPLLAWTWIVLFGLAALTLVYVYLIEPFLQRSHPWRVSAIRPVALKTWQVALEPEGHGGMKYAAGQFAWLNIGRSPFSLHENPFSISSAPAAGRTLKFIIKELGDFTGTLGQIKSGTIAHLDGPHGNLVISGRTEPGIALIAGGVGIAPMIGILSQLGLEKDPRPCCLVYGNRVAAQIVFPDELEALTQAQGCQFVRVLSEPPPDWSGRTGMIDGKLIAELFAGRKDWLYILCGPPPMMEAVEDELIALGVHASQILSERFRYD